MSLEHGPTIAVLQPGYLPWLGFFDQMRRSDIFVIYDNVQFDKQGWRNRNRIKSPAGPHWLTVPVHLQSPGQSILEVAIDNRSPWARKHVGTIRQFYARAPFLDNYMPQLEELLHRRWERIVDLDLEVINLMCGWMGFATRCVRASELDVQGGATERLIEMCKRFGASRYLTGDAARSYLDVALFAQSGIEVEWQNYRHPVYKQQHGDFVPYLSALDLVLNCGEESAAIVSAGGAEMGIN